jgi:hypothetical protein
MNTDQTTNFILNELTKHRDRNDIILDLCRQLGIEWKAAEQLVKDVESQHGKTVAKRQSPFLIILGASIIITGLGLTINGMQLIFDLLSVGSIEQLMGMSTSLFRLGSLLTGIGMIVGGIIGFWKTFSAFLG